jgi:nucleoside-diphosphate-sugar epimerase
MMSKPKVLFIGGTGVISTSCVYEAVRQGLDITVLNRGNPSVRQLPAGVSVVTGDVSNPEQVRAAIGDTDFDVVVNWVNFTPEQVQRDLELFSGRVGQYVFISSASAYQTPPTRMPVIESTPLKNPYWQYSRNKIACEELLITAYREDDFPATIVRPSHTYDQTKVPFNGGWTTVERMRAGKPVVVHGDGTSLWTLTHSRDFAVAFTGMLGRAEAIGEAYHITSDEAPSWNQIYHWVAEAAGVDEPQLVHVPSDVIMANDPDWGAALIGDKANTMIFDNSKIKSLVPAFGQSMIPYRQGISEVIAWFDAHPDHKIIDEKMNSLMDRLIEAYAPRAV